MQNDPLDRMIDEELARAKDEAALDERIDQLAADLEADDTTPTRGVKIELRRADDGLWWADYNDHATGHTTGASHNPYLALRGALDLLKDQAQSIRWEQELAEHPRKATLARQVETFYVLTDDESWMDDSMKEWEVDGNLLSSYRERIEVATRVEFRLRDKELARACSQILGRDIHPTTASFPILRSGDIVLVVHKVEGEQLFVVPYKCSHSFV